MTSFETRILCKDFSHNHAFYIKKTPDTPPVYLFGIFDWLVDIASIGLAGTHYKRWIVHAYDAVHDIRIVISSLWFSKLYGRALRFIFELVKLHK